MLAGIKHFFSKIPTDGVPAGGETPAHDIHVAVCALLVELASIDEHFTRAEMEAILAILKEKYGLAGEHADALIAEAEKELEESVDLWQFASLINRNYSNEEKIAIIEALWQVVYVDGKMDKYEHYLMNKLKHLLRLSHDQLIDAKLKVLHGDRS
ncbi:MAG: TerB family tellurite resistance protein [Deltaproteobacteria bacterium]|nr:TerB family tellurite resistance protein [Deltaproteobacteria bacterium]